MKAAKVGQMASYARRSEDWEFQESTAEIELKQIEKQIQKIAAITVAQAMTPDPIFVEPGTSIEVVASLMVDNGFHTIPVLDEEKLVGVVGKEDILKTLIANNTVD